VVSRGQVEKTRRAYPSWERALQHVYRENLLNNLMRTSELFAPLPADAKRNLVKQFRLKRLPPRTQIFGEGQPIDGLDVVLEGRVEVVVRQRGRRRVLAQWESGAVFGEESLFGSPRGGGHALKTGKKTTVLRLPRKSFTEVLAGFPKSWSHVQNLAASRPVSLPERDLTLI
jgi:CRP-like cAMP-binding protein